MLGISYPMSKIKTEGYVIISDKDNYYGSNEEFHGLIKYPWEGGNTVYAPISGKYKLIGNRDQIIEKTYQEQLYDIATSLFADVSKTKVIEADPEPGKQSDDFSGISIFGEINGHTVNVVLLNVIIPKGVPLQGDIEQNQRIGITEPQYNLLENIIIDDTAKYHPIKAGDLLGGLYYPDEKAQADKENKTADDASTPEVEKGKPAAQGGAGAILLLVPVIPLAMWAIKKMRKGRE